MIAAGGEESARRVDPADGNAYTQAEFVEQYSGVEQWTAAELCVLPLPSLLTPSLCSLLCLRLLICLRLRRLLLIAHTHNQAIPCG